MILHKNMIDENSPLNTKVSNSLTNFLFFFFFLNLQTFSLPKLLVKVDCNRQVSHQLSCKKGEVILLISKAFQFL